MWMSQARGAAMRATHGRAAARWHAEADRLTRERDRHAATRPKQLAATGTLSRRTAPSAPAKHTIRGRGALYVSTATACGPCRESMTTEVKICGLTHARRRSTPRSPAAPTTSASSSMHAARATSRRPRRACSPPARAARRRSSRCSSTPTTALLAEVIDAVAPDILQLHGVGDAGARRRDRPALRPPGDEGGDRRRRRRRAGGAGLRRQGRPHPVRRQGAVGRRRGAARRQRRRLRLAGAGWA